MNAVKLMSCAGCGAEWREEPGKAVMLDKDRFGVEPHFMREILKWRIPLLLGGVSYQPLCQEFPGSPGIDLIYLASDGSLLVAEVKRDQRSAGQGKLYRESLHHVYKHRDKTLGELVAYCNRRPEESVEGGAAILKSWMKRHGLKASLTLETLIAKGLLSAAGVIGEPLNAALRKSILPGYAVFGIQAIKGKGGLRVQMETTHSGSPANPVQFMAQLKESYKEYEHQDKKSGLRVMGKLDAVKRNFESLEPIQPGRIFYDAALEWGLGLQPGSGKDADWGANARFKDASGKMRTLFTIRRANQLFIPAGEMRGQAGSLKIPEKEVREMQKNIECTMPPPACSVSPAGNITLDFSKAGSGSNRLVRDVRDRLYRFLRLCRGE